MVTYDKTIFNRLKRTEGQLRGIQKMIAENQDCVDVVTQLSAVRSSIDHVMGIIVAENLKQCLENPEPNHNQQQAKLEKAINLIVKK
ncbi:metal-sensitive transcriptional regulator [Enterococcus casseliflavus]|uniref:metal-sensitive transcriptional regulator n=1 Tax=Enterococcus casseliflavus TaxID=37734 RepID=UPI0035CB899D